MFLIIYKDMGNFCSANCFFFEPKEPTNSTSELIYSRIVTHDTDEYTLDRVFQKAPQIIEYCSYVYSFTWTDSFLLRYEPVKTIFSSIQQPTCHAILVLDYEEKQPPSWHSNETNYSPCLVLPNPF